MRQIKFRAWDHESKRMVEGPMVHITLDGEIGCTAPVCHPDNLKLMQFTGLLDKTGKEIFEGDIVKSHDLKREVYWKLGGFWTKVINGEGDCMMWMHDIPDYDMEVVGNIYESPELLK